MKNINKTQTLTKNTLIKQRIRISETILPSSALNSWFVFNADDGDIFTGMHKGICKCTFCVHLDFNMFYF